MESRPLVPPLRYACVDEGIYRGCYPHPISAGFLRKLNLRTIVSVTPEPLPEHIRKAFGNDIEYIHLVSGAEEKKSKKKRVIPLSNELVDKVMELLKSKEKRPIYLHCLNGQQVTSLLIGCFRVDSDWSLRSALLEFVRFSEYGRTDIAFIERYIK